jgi:hypothetical protein
MTSKRQSIGRGRGGDDAAGETAGEARMADRAVRPLAPGARLSGDQVEGAWGASMFESTPYLTLSQVAARTGRHPELLRQWCAAGRIPCHRLGGSWVVLERDLPLVDQMATRTRRRLAAAAPLSGDRRLLAAVYEHPARAAEASDALRERLRLEAGAVETGPLGVGTLEAMGLTVVAGRVPAEVVLDARRILASYGGRIVAELDADPAPTLQPRRAERRERVSR